MLVTSLANPTVELVANHLETHTFVWLTFGVALGPIVAIGLAVLVVFKWFIPFYKEEAAASRQHLADVLSQTRKDASEDLKASRDTSREQHTALVTQIGDKLTETHRTVGDIHRIVTSLAVRAGTVTVLLWSLSFGVGTSFGLAWQTVRERRNVSEARQQLVQQQVQERQRQQQHPFVPELSHDCTDIGGCKAPEYCCAKNGCCRNARSEDDNYAAVPHSLRHGDRDLGDDVRIGWWRG